MNVQPRARQARPEARGRTACLLAAIWLIVGAAGLGAAPETRTDKISPVILAHRDAKRQPLALAPEAHRRDLEARGLNAGDLSGESCALYTERPLSAAEREALEGRGIAIVPGLWIPPVAGRHPQGFHLARVAYDSLDAVRDDPRLVRLESAEIRSRPLNDLATGQMGADDVQAGQGVGPFSGAGVRIAVADSGLDLTHADFPVPFEAYDLTTGTSPADWSTTVANTVTPHGTHVTASALGRGTRSNGRYRGSAPGADLCFYKIGSSANGSATEADMIEAIDRAAAVNARVFSLSYGGFSTYMDGSEAAEQAIDAAEAAGVAVFVAAGNDAAAKLHDSVSVAPGTTSDALGFTINNPYSTSYETPQYLQVIWRDGTPGADNVSLVCTNLKTTGPGRESLTLLSGSTSVRGTESREYQLNPVIAAGGQKTYWFRLQNSAGAGAAVLVHLYRTSGAGTFDTPDSAFTVGHPAVADGAIAVGAWTQRRSWIDAWGSSHYYPDLTVNTLAPFSSRGPRIDGLRKPDLVAPGAATISARESVPGLAVNTALVIDNDGLNLDGSGSADYYVMRGTSMACPMAAGVAALMLQGNPGLAPAQIRSALTNTASRAASPDNDVGSGLVNAWAAVRQVTPVTLTVVSTYGGASPGTLTTAFGTTLTQWVTNSPLPFGMATQQVCLAAVVTGNDHVQETPTQATLTLTNNATLTWQWQTRYLLAVGQTGAGEVTAASGWQAAGSSTTLTARAGLYWHLAGWSGDTGGCVVVGSSLVADMSQARALTAHFEPNLTPMGTPESWLAGFGLTNGAFAETEQLDPDGDGQPSWAEYVADTNPTNTESVLAFTSIRAEGTGIRLAWHGGQWARQYLDERGLLSGTGGAWTCVLTNAVLPTAISNTTWRTPAGAARRFFRLRAER